MPNTALHSRSLLFAPAVRLCAPHPQAPLTARMYGESLWSSIMRIWAGEGLSWQRRNMRQKAVEGPRALPDIHGSQCSTLRARQTGAVERLGAVEQASQGEIQAISCTSAEARAWTYSTGP